MSYKTKNSKQKLYTHPSNLAFFEEWIEKEFLYQGGDESFVYVIDRGKSICGIDVITCPSLPEKVTKKTGNILWPDDKSWDFCEFEDKDKSWMLYFGFAKEETYEERYFLMVDVPEYDWGLTPLGKQF